jgi:arylsulfatase A-like enzyme
VRAGTPPDVIVVSVDCMRRDRLSAYGYHRATTPFLDSLLDRSLHCTSAHSVSSWTCPAVISLLTGLYPHQHGGGLVPGDPKNLSRDNLPTSLPSDVTTLSGLVGDRGYATAAVGGVWNAHLPLPGTFQHMALVERGAARLVKRSLDWIRGQRGPVFLWLHLGDPHEPLRVHRSLRSVFGRVPRVPKVRRWDYQSRDADVESSAGRRYRDARIRLYDAAVRSADRSLAVLWAGLADLGRQDRTLFAVTADHGEEFWEHRDEEIERFADPRDLFGVGHGHNLFQVHLLIPLLLAGPGIPPGAVEENASLVDLFPTVLEALRIDGPAVDGRSLLDPPALRERAILAEGIAYGHEKKAVILQDSKLLSSPADRYEEVFRLGADRLEAGPAEDPGAGARLREHLPAGGARVGQQIEPTPEIEEHLRHLGYLE